MKYFAVVLLSVLLIQPSQAQTRKPYRTSAGELIFSYGLVTDTAGNQYKSALRFSAFFHTQYQFHFDFGKAAGMYTGIGVRNVGLITHPNDSLKVKQRAYGLGVPLAFKFGNMDTRKYFSIGAEAEYFFNYKEKIYIHNKKMKHNDWFSDRVTPFNPSVFVEFEGKSFFIKAKYYLFDFLKPQNDLKLRDNEFLPGYSKSSQLFYISVGLNIKSKGKSDYKSVMPKKAST